jgi:hypothetical protein
MYIAKNIDLDNANLAELQIVTDDFFRLQDRIKQLATCS